jgi:pyrroloquinoline quinone biosynthesis protein E
MEARAVLPKSLIFEVTPRCNSNCRYCYNVWKNTPGYPGGELSHWKLSGLLKKVVRQTKAQQVTLTGGEPLLREDLERIVKMLRRLGVEVNIITNATLLSEERIKKLVSLGVANFEVPLLSDKREVHNRLMRFDAFDLVTQAMVKIKKYSGKVVTVFVATKENIGDFEEMAKLAFALGADGIMFNRFNPGGQGANFIQELLPGAREMREALKVANCISEKYHIGIACSIPIQPCIVDTTEFKNLNFGFCSAGTEKAYYAVDPLGNLRMCNHSPRILGNLFKRSFQDLIAQEAAKDFVTSIPQFCASCGKKTICQGGCKAAAESCSGSSQNEDPFLTEHLPS